MTWKKFLLFSLPNAAKRHLKSVSLQSHWWVGTGGTLRVRHLCQSMLSCHNITSCHIVNVVLSQHNTLSHCNSCPVIA